MVPPPDPAHDPEGSSKQPPVNLIPLANVEVAVELFNMDPPVIVRPLDEDNPPPATDNPAEDQLEVADPEYVKAPEIARVVEVAFVVVARPLTISPVPASKVRIPDVNESDVSERRNCVESRVSRV